MSESQYDASHIEVLEGLAAIRKRPGMYIGSTTERGLHRLVDELVGHAMDEAAGGRAASVGVTLTADGGVRVADDGRGIPAEDIETALTEFRAGSFNAVGICAVNALSRRVEVEVRRDGGASRSPRRAGTSRLRTRVPRSPSGPTPTSSGPRSARPPRSPTASGSWPPSASPWY